MSRYTVGSDLPAGRSLQCIWATNIFDDASLWIQKPDAPPEGFSPAFAKRIKKYADLKGQNVCVSVLNNQEHIFRQLSRIDEVSDSCGYACAFEVQSPARVLPQANSATVRDRLRQWSVLVPGGAGKMVSAGDDSLTDATRNTVWPTLFTCKDNLVVNDCVTFMEENVITASRRHPAAHTTDKDFTLMPITCCGHNAVLSTKPIVKDGCRGLAAVLVKLGHVLGSQKAARDFAKHVGDIFDESFNYRQVASFSDRIVAAQGKARDILIRSRPDGNLTVDQEKLILSADNDDWDSLLVWHNCVLDCPLGCEGDEVKSKKICKEAVLLSICTKFAVALEYRWKAMDQALATLFRGTKQHQLLNRALDRMFFSN